VNVDVFPLVKAILVGVTVQCEFTGTFPHVRFTVPLKVADASSDSE
jgi:hypothetical protein